VVSEDWQVSMVITASPTGTLAAPQQRFSLQVVSPLVGLKVPFDKAFSHLHPASPAAGASASAYVTRARMSSRSSSLAPIAS